jgi:hypothetical protein
MVAEKAGREGGSVTILRSDGSQAPGSPVSGNGIVVPWAIAVDGNDHIWVSNFTYSLPDIVELCGYRTDTCPPGMKMGDPISPLGGYVGGGLQMAIDIAIDPAGDVWVSNNWQDWQAGIERVPEARSTLVAAQGLVVFYRMAKPVRTPQIGPAKPL